MTPLLEEMDQLSDGGQKLVAKGQKNSGSRSRSDRMRIWILETRDMGAAGGYGARKWWSQGG